MNKEKQRISGYALISEFELAVREFIISLFHKLYGNQWIKRI